MANSCRETVVNVADLRRVLERRKGQQESLLLLLSKGRDSLTFLQQELTMIKEAQATVQVVAQTTQMEVQHYISKLVSLAMRAVFEYPYTMMLEFVQKRGKTEGELWFERDGNRTHPLMAAGGGAVDVAAFALRVSLWALGGRRNRAVLVLDEPFKHLSIDAQSKAGEMLKEISKKLSLQIIMVSHVTDVEEFADRIFKVSFKNGKSEVSQYEE